MQVSLSNSLETEQVGMHPADDRTRSVVIGCVTIKVPRTVQVTLTAQA